MYLSLALFAEGTSDHDYLEPILVRSIEDIAARESRRTIDLSQTVIRLSAGARDVDRVSAEICKGMENPPPFHIVFIHADTGGRAVERTLAQRSAAFCEAAQHACGWPCDRCVIVAPRHETEAWVIADPDAVAATLGVTRPERLRLPADARAAERLADPKARLEQALSLVSRGRRRRVEDLYPSIAQRQDLAKLRVSESFAAFEQGLRTALRSYGLLG